MVGVGLDEFLNLEIPAVYSIYFHLLSSSTLRPSRVHDE
jgi:hypothetical protein